MSAFYIENLCSYWRARLCGLPVNAPIERFTSPPRRPIQNVKPFDTTLSLSAPRNPVWLMKMFRLARPNKKEKRIIRPRPNDNRFSFGGRPKNETILRYFYIFTGSRSDTNMVKNGFYYFFFFFICSRWRWREIGFRSARRRRIGVDILRQIILGEYGQKTNAKYVYVLYCYSTQIKREYFSLSRQRAEQ